MLPSRTFSTVEATEATTTDTNMMPPHITTSTASPVARLAPHTTPAGSPYITDETPTSTPAAGRPTRVRPVSRRFPVAPSTLSPPRPPTTSDESSIPFTRPSPETLREVFPTELPPRPQPKRSFFKRVFDRRTTRSEEDTASPRSARPEEDVEMGVLGGTAVTPARQQANVRRMRIGGFLLIGVVFGVATALFVYSLVRRQKGFDKPEKGGGGGELWDY